MSVKELIEQLKEMPQDLSVHIIVYGEEKQAEKVEKTAPLGLFEFVEIS